MERWTCPYCEKPMILKSKHTKSGHLAGCQEWKNWRDTTLTEEFLRSEYHTKGKSMLQISEELGLSSVAAIDRKMKSFGIKTRSVSEAKKMPKARKRARETNIELYGAPHNFCKDHPSRKEWEARLLEEEGITNVFQREEVKEKIKQTYEDRYGVRNLWELDWYREKIEQSMRFTSIHRKVCEGLTEMGVAHSIEFPLPREGDRRYFYDIRIEGSTRLIEVNGDYWHANPDIYASTDIFHFPQGTMTAREIWERDEDKLDVAINKGYEILILWETDVNEDWASCKTALQQYVGDVDES